MKEIFTLLQDSYSIAGIPIDELNKLFLNDDYSSYAVSMIGKDKIILKNKTYLTFVSFLISIFYCKWI